MPKKFKKWFNKKKSKDNNSLGGNDNNGLAQGASGFQDAGGHAQKSAKQQQSSGKGKKKGRSAWDVICQEQERRQRQNISWAEEMDRHEKEQKRQEELQARQARLRTPMHESGLHSTKEKGKAPEVRHSSKQESSTNPRKCRDWVTEVTCHKTPREGWFGGSSSGSSGYGSFAGGSAWGGSRGRSLGGGFGGGGFGGGGGSSWGQNSWF